MVALQTVEIPGFREAVARERKLRDRAFLGGNEIVCGVVVKQLSLRTLIMLEHAENGFVIPYRYDTGLELVSHAMQVLWFARAEWQPPEVKPFSFWRSFYNSVAERKFQTKLLRAYKPMQLVEEVQEWLDESFVDSPSGSADKTFVPSYVAYPAHVVDLFADAGLLFTYDEIMDMPLKRLWQHWRLAAHRVYNRALTNPSDKIAVEHLAKGRN